MGRTKGKAVEKGSSAMLRRAWQKHMRCSIQSSEGLLADGAIWPVGGATKSGTVLSHAWVRQQVECFFRPKTPGLSL